MWAFATSPHGLGLCETDFWCFSYRELNAHLAVYEETTINRWAISQAEFRNAHGLGVEFGIGWTAEEVLGRGDRIHRLKQGQKDKSEVDMLNMRMDRIQRGMAAPAGMHPVFMGEYHGGEPS